MKTYAIVPARGGSKGIPGKNMASVAGKPLIGYTIEIAFNSTRLDAIVVSSDSDEILDYSAGYQVILHQRNQSISTDSSSVIDTISSVAKENNWNDDDIIVLLQPTSPIRYPHQLDEAVDYFKASGKHNSLISVCEMNDVHPARMYWREDDNLVTMMPEFEQTRRQDIPPVYYRNGSIYISTVEKINKHNAIMISPVLPYVMPYDQLLNIDEPRDLLIAEPLIKEWQERLEK